ncbi:MAG: DNA-binding protein [Flavobacteriaceae bacterium]|nr:DNA-binding protein [Flavobacteriaceae bacterium]
MKEGDKVNLIIGKESPLGFAVLIDEEFEGLLYKNEIFQNVVEGMSIMGYIKKIREDGKIDVSLTPQGFRKNIEALIAHILKQLQQNNGVLYVSDKSTPEEIKNTLQMSKKNFKKAIGTLYRLKKITITEDCIYLIKNKG